MPLDAGARVQSGHRVVGRQIAGSERRVQARTPAGVEDAAHPRFVVDATGRTGTAGDAGSDAVRAPSIAAVTGWRPRTRIRVCTVGKRRRTPAGSNSAEREDGCVAAMN